MHIFADLHIHIYPFYDYEKVFLYIEKRLCGIFQNQCSDTESECRRQKAESRKRKDKIAIIALTERDDCNFFKELKSKKINIANFEFIESNDRFVLLEVEDISLYIFPGRQLNTIEKVELLSLGQDTIVPSGLPVLDTLEKIHQAGATPVINWAPGKWWFKRGKIIKELINNRSLEFILCDTSLRPVLYRKPSLMKSGRKVIYGSDPLPIENEYKNIFRYYSEFKDIDFDTGRDFFTNLLTKSQAKACGRRSGVLEVFFRLFGNYLPKMTE